MAEQRTMTTYRRADGGMIADEFSFVTGLEWFEPDLDPVDLVREVWVLETRTTGTYTPPGCTVECTHCHGEGGDCPICDGAGLVDAFEGWTDR